MKHIIRTTAFTLILASSLLAVEAKADRQGGGTLFTSGHVSVDKWIDFDARFVPVAVPDINLSDVTTKPVSEFVRFKSAQGDQVTFDYTWFVGADKGLAEVTLDKAKASEQTADLIRALLESKAKSNWEAIK
ncbi:MAG: hypothetical protein J0L82_10145 [Deltaproteobacteria bacterium]|jgi:hypothetical protein|nr:hypothetical protein [Deltaproteobacteria bacterium]